MSTREVGRLAADDRLRVVRVLGGLGHRERERDVLHELGLDQLLVVRELEDAAAVLGLPLVVGDGVATPPRRSTSPA